MNINNSLMLYRLHSFFMFYDPKLARKVQCSLPNAKSYLSRTRGGNFFEPCSEVLNQETFILTLHCNNI